MITVKSAEFLITLTSYIIAYVILLPIVGCFQAWVAKKMGDEGPEDQGLMTLNPVAHLNSMNIIGFLFLVFVGVGWGERVKINPLNITGPHRWIKLTIAFLADVFAHVILATCAIVGLLALFGPYVLNLSADMMLSGQLSHARFAAAFPESSSMAISLALILVASIYLNVLLAVFDSMYRAIEWLMVYLTEHAPEASRYNNILLIFAFIFIACMFIIPQVRVYLVLLIMTWGYILANLFGAL
jgi:hypothetical protein